jgi:WD40 repeat protein
MRSILPLVALALALPASGAATTPSPVATSALLRVTAHGKSPVPVAPIGDQYRRMAGSPDGRQIAFTTPEGLWITNGDRSSNRMISPDGTAVDNTGTQEIAWSGNGRRLAIGTCVGDRGSCVRRVAVIDVQSGRKTALPFEAESPSLSQDGSQIAVLDESTRTVVVTTPNGRILARLGHIQDARFSPREQLIAYVNASGEVCLTRSTGERRRCLGVRGSKPVWSPNGTRLAFQTTGSAGFYWRIALAKTGEQRSIRRVPARFSLPPDMAWTGGNAGVSWSPNGRLLAYGGDRLHVLEGRISRTFSLAAPCYVSGTAFTRGNSIVFSAVCLNWSGP